MPRFVRRLQVSDYVKDRNCFQWKWREFWEKVWPWAGCIMLLCAMGSAKATLAVIRLFIASLKGTQSVRVSALYHRCQLWYLVLCVRQFKIVIPVQEITRGGGRGLQRHLVVQGVYFITFVSSAAFCRRKSESIGTARDSCSAQGRDTLAACASGLFRPEIVLQHSMYDASNWRILSI
jgi:hypothetical protein